MRAVSIAVSQTAISRADTSVGETLVTRKGDKSVADDENWFAEAGLLLLNQDKPGTELYCVTGMQFGERNCQRYTDGSVKPSAYFLRALLRSDQGRQWLNAVMDGCKAEWWLTLQDERRIGAAVRSVVTRD